jgi:hypothetical protein
MRSHVMDGIVTEISFGSWKVLTQGSSTFNNSIAASSVHRGDSNACPPDQELGLRRSNQRAC